MLCVPYVLFLSCEYVAGPGPVYVWDVLCVCVCVTVGATGLYGPGLEDRRKNLRKREKK